MARERKPEWFKTAPPWGRTFAHVDGLLRAEGLNTVCRSALCPNIGHCFNRGTATFLLLGNRCTRSCPFCNVEHGGPLRVDPEEPEKVARAVERLELRHAVLTSVTRDDLEDGGASHFARTVAAIRARRPGATIEVLIPDFGGSDDALMTVLSSRPEVLNHNLETVRDLYPRVRPQADYDRSLRLLDRARRTAEPPLTKSGLMVGFGEDRQALTRTLSDLLEVGCRLLTLGQYLRPPRSPLTVERYYTPQEFSELGARALQMGFEHVEAGPLVRSSYHAERQLETCSP